MGLAPVDVFNAWATGCDFVDRHLPIAAVLAAVLAVAAVTLAVRSLRRASRHVDDLIHEQQTASWTRKETEPS